MSTLSFLLATHTKLSGDEVAHLQRLASEWQLLSDLSFADFLLWVPVTTTVFLFADFPSTGANACRGPRRIRSAGPVTRGRHEPPPPPVQTDSFAASSAIRLP